MLYCPFYWCWMMYTVVHSIGYSLLCSMDARLFITTILTRQGILLPYYLEITVAITNGNKVAIFLDVIVVIGIHRAQDHKMILFSFFSSARKETNCYHFMVLCTEKWKTIPKPTTFPGLNFLRKEVCSLRELEEKVVGFGIVCNFSSSPNNFHINLRLITTLWLWVYLVMNWNCNQTWDG